MDPIAEALSLAKDGHRVLWLDQTARAAEQAHRYAFGQAGPDATRQGSLISWPNGGRLRFQSGQAQFARGQAIDVVIITCDTVNHQVMSDLVTGTLFSARPPSKRFLIRTRTD
ncbi:hypothetical protein [Pseudoclavibacter sp. RFBB5]|uniref:hypothetical protein n=1 Tax=Pseudoclavibacter sp. RFBB5 TaxID=2080574 RepID=UPI000CE86460|nr:hypothetical protein [Pseudoclavibacter sp. RFBB5]PPG29656.1 hypothetical protein C5B97_11850 [Pseudoclavibacter sp. RFBB5]